MCVLSRIVGRGLAPAEASGMEYTSFGKIAEHQLLSLEDRYEFLSVDKYVIMPNHIHVVLILESEAAGASPRPTITDIVCAYKSLTTRECKNNGFDGKLFQTSFYECSVGANCVRPQNLPLSNIGKIVLDELERWNQTYPRYHCILT